MPWRLSVKNASSEPLLVVADPRLLWFEVKVPGKQKATICRLPGEVFPKHPDPATELVLRPGESVTHRFDPRLYCFGESGQTELVPGSQVSPRFGWPEERRTKWVNGKRAEEVVDRPPHVARGIDDATVSALARNQRRPAPPANALPAVKVVSGDGFALGSEYAPWSRARLPSAARTEGPLRLTLKQGSDAEAERTATVQLELRNRGAEPRFVYFRRELVSFEVVGPSGLSDCGAEPDHRSPDRHAFQRLAPGQSVTVYQRLVEACPRGTFATPGLYLVHARYESVHDGAEFELDAFVGRVSTEQPVGVRIRKGDRPPPRRMEHVRPER
ncbi:MAG: hypothetical protein JW751_23475 [Polyangiaceae bacterium]|nr:hypothetical protein [Polyangiaceae bacterium]